MFENFEQLHSPAKDTANNLREISVHKLIAGVGQPREFFEDTTMQELAASVKQHGILQPLVVRSKYSDQENENQYEIIAGERRWRAAKQAGLQTVPCLVMDVTDDKTLALALVENIQREDLNALEEAQAYRKILHKLNCTQEQLAKSLGKNRATIANALRLLKLPSNVKKLIVQKRISMGHARALAILDAQTANALAKDIVQKGMSVRQAEAAVQAKKRPAQSPKKEPFVHQRIRQQLQEDLGVRVELRHKKNAGSIVLHFSSPQELNRLLEVLTHSNTNPHK